MVALSSASYSIYHDWHLTSTYEYKICSIEGISMFILVLDSGMRESHLTKYIIANA